MKKIILIIVISLFSFQLIGQVKLNWAGVVNCAKCEADKAFSWDSTVIMRQKIDSSIKAHSIWIRDITMVMVTLESMKKKRFDAICRFRFRHAHRINKLIKKYYHGT